MDQIDEVNSPYPITELNSKHLTFNVVEIDGHDFDQIADAFKTGKRMLKENQQRSL